MGRHLISSWRMAAQVCNQDRLTIQAQSAKPIWHLLHAVPTALVCSVPGLHVLLSPPFLGVLGSVPRKLGFFRSYSLVTRCFMRACLVVANIFGRVALSVPWLWFGINPLRNCLHSRWSAFWLSGTRVRAARCRVLLRIRRGKANCPNWSIQLGWWRPCRQYVEGVIGGIGIQLLFSFISRLRIWVSHLDAFGVLFVAPYATRVGRLLQLTWTAVLLLFHSTGPRLHSWTIGAFGENLTPHAAEPVGRCNRMSGMTRGREFKQDVEWDAQSRQKQVKKWLLQDIVSATALRRCIADIAAYDMTW